MHEMPRTPQTFNVWQLPPPWGRALWSYHQNIFDGNCMKCTELHEAHVS